MTAPFRSRPAPYGHFRVNNDSRKLDQLYERVLGQGGDKALTEEVKWLAVTHKSFDHGRRGYNDRLAYLGIEDASHVLGNGMLMQSYLQARE